MVLADGVVRPSQLSAFEQICQQQFGLESRKTWRSLHMRCLIRRKARFSEAEAFSLIRQLDTDKRSALLGEMMQIARPMPSLTRAKRS
jgi:uncharacterized tellurite resistance protein B-like protein